MDKETQQKKETGKLRRSYDEKFEVTPEYRDSLPDMQNAQANTIEGSDVPILRVGISGFRLPLKYTAPDGDILSLETKVTGTVRLESGKKGINMSRVMRTFYEFREEVFDPETLESVLHRYKEALSSLEARLKLAFSYPMEQESLRSGLRGIQYYDCWFEGTLDHSDRFRRFMHLDFIYSSACPCASELAEHAREHRDTMAIPHSQRSKARVSIEIAPGREVSLLELRDLCIAALKTETQVMVKREDEQAFAEMNGAHVKFVEDAARLLYEQLMDDERIVDFRIICAHFESLHSHDAIASLVRGVSGGFTAEFEDFSSLNA
ncbi:MAG: GTP cyclohydrolase I FolE2 [Opitutae bacterium]|nr:GTP cyclohydrolase I FolE2 [Opitutae bacterium]|tara:strand:+ start:67 stop:1029 length:963 start_codon:yes stop_codon:yes gene_type:complete